MDVETLMCDLGNEDPRVRRQARALLERAGSEVAPRAAALLRHKDWEVRRGAAEALRTVGGPECGPALCEALPDPDWEVRLEAASALERLAGRQAIPALCAALSDEHPRVRQTVLRTLERITGELEQRGHASRSAILLDIAAACRLEQVPEGLPPAWTDEAAPLMVAPLAAVLQDEDRQCRAAAVALLVRVADERAVPALCAALADRSVAKLAALALCRVGDEQAIIPLVRALRHTDRVVRFTAAIALAEVANRHPCPQARQALPVLRELGTAGVRILDSRFGPGRSPYLAAHSRIDAATAHLRDLPLPAAGSVTELAQLPVPAGNAGVTPAPQPRPDGNAFLRLLRAALTWVLAVILRLRHRRSI